MYPLKPVVTCIGDCGIDHFLRQDRKFFGGITLNFSTALARVGHKDLDVRVVSAVGTDRYANQIRKALQNEGIQINIEEIEGDTPVCCIDHIGNGERFFPEYREGVLSKFRLSSPARKWIQESDWVVIPRFSQIEELFRSVMAEPRQGNRVIDFSDLNDFNRDPMSAAPWIEEGDIGFFGLSANREQLIQELSDLFRKKNALLVVTLGGEGSMAVHGPHYFRAEAVKAHGPIVDTTGAGDAFAAAFFHQYIKTGNIQQSLRAGATQAAEVIQFLGANQLPFEG